MKERETLENCNAEVINTSPTVDGSVNPPDIETLANTQEESIAERLADLEMAKHDITNRTKKLFIVQMLCIAGSLLIALPALYCVKTMPEFRESIQRVESSNYSIIFRFAFILSLVIMYCKVLHTDDIKLTKFQDFIFLCNAGMIAFFQMSTIFPILCLPVIATMPDSSSLNTHCLFILAGAIFSFSSYLIPFIVLKLCRSKINFYQEKLRNTEDF